MILSLSPITDQLSPINPRHLQLTDRPKTVRGLRLHADTANHAFVSPTYLVFAFFFLENLPSNCTLYLHPRQGLAGPSRSRRKGINKSPGALWVELGKHDIGEALYHSQSHAVSVLTSLLLSLCLSLSLSHFFFSFWVSCSLVHAHRHRHDFNPWFDSRSTSLRPRQWEREGEREREQGFPMDGVTCYASGLAASLSMPTREK